jgi:hypothetical protein
MTSSGGAGVRGRRCDKLHPRPCGEVLMDFRRAVVLIILSFTSAVSRSQSHATDLNVLDAEKAELTHSLDELKRQEVAPYFLSYEIIETHSATVTGSFGTLVHSGENKRRQLHIDLRVGDDSLDNTRQVRGNPLNPVDRFAMIPVPIEDDPTAIRSILWYQTDKKYKKAVEELTTARMNSQVKVDQEDSRRTFPKNERNKASNRLRPCGQIGKFGRIRYAGTRHRSSVSETSMRRRRFCRRIRTRVGSFRATAQPFKLRRRTIDCSSLPSPKPATGWNCPGTSPTSHLRRKVCPRMPPF